MSPDLARALAERLDRPVPDGARRVAAALADRHGAALAAVLFYGSNLRRGDDREGLLDVYALVDDYRAAYRRVAPALAARALPPNVHYLELPHPQGGVLRAKVAVLSLAAFARGTRPGRLESYFWGRFCQPSALVWGRDDAARAAVVAAVGQALVAALGAARAVSAPQGTVAALWASVLDACYGAELRPERAGVGARLVGADAPWYAALTPLVAAQVRGLEVAGPGLDASYRWGAGSAQLGPARAAWTARRVWGKTRNLARLVKAAFTFAGGVDYVLWKLERHTGAPVPRTALLARWPYLGIWPVAWRAYRRGRRVNRPG